MEADKSPQRDDMRLEIVSALERLLEHTPYTQISVANICAEAHVSKTTFYRYFQNKESVVHWIMQMSIIYGSGEIGRKYTWFEGHYITSLMQFRHRAVFCDQQNPELVAEFSSFSAKCFMDAMVETITQYHKVELTERLSFQLEALIRAQGYMARRWAEEGMVIPPETMASYFTSIVPYDLFKLLNNPVLPRKNETA